MKNKSTWQLFVVPHTHWDKEWYFTKQDSDILLCENINKLLKMLDENKIDSFTFDGQFSIIDDYLNYSNNNLNKIKKYTKEKRFIVGPWYTQPDFFNITSESIVRNLLYGINGCEKIGANYLKVAYVPDSFGHNSQMPQIYKQFGIENFIYWRGISKKILQKNGIINLWEGENSDSVLSYNLLFGYWPFGANFPYQTISKNNIDIKAEEFLQNTKELIDEIKNNSKKVTNKILIPLGGDQAPIMNYLKEFIEALNKISNDNWQISDYDSFFNELKKDLIDVPIINKELKSPYLSRIHKTIGSQRQDIKNKIKHLEIEIYGNLEPLMVYWFINSSSYDKEFIDKILKNILTCQAHDSIGGCNSDRTNSDILNRLEQTLDMVESLKTKILKNIAYNLKLKDEEFLIFNPDLNQILLNKKIKIFSKYKNISIRTAENKLVNFSIINKKYHNEGMKVKPSINGEQVENSLAFYEYDILINNLILEANQILVLKIIKNNFKLLNIVPEKKFSFDIKLENEKIIIKDLLTTKSTSIYFEAEHDCGDSYDFSPKQNKKILINEFISSSINFKKLQNLELIEIVMKYKVPSSEKQNIFLIQNFIITIYINNNSILDINIKTKNNSSEIRWRIISELKSKTNILISDQCYSVISRKHNLDLKNWKQENWKEAPVNIESFESLIGINKNHFIYNNGINEYELVDDDKIALTLYRTVSSLGRNDLLWRPGRASGTSEFNISTESSKLINHNFDFNFMFDFRNNINFAKESQLYIKECLFYQKQTMNNLYKRFDRFLFDFQNLNLNFENNIKISNNNFVIKSIKKAENSNDIIIRGFNPTDKILEVQFLLNNKEITFSLLNLKENILENDIKK